MRQIYVDKKYETQRFFAFKKDQAFENVSSQGCLNFNQIKSNRASIFYMAKKISMGDFEIGFWIP